jgi:hypothetical protein
MQRILLFILCGLLACAPKQDKQTIDTNAQPFKEPKIAFNPKQYVCYKTDSPLKIDGKAKEAAWQHAEWTDDFIDIEGDAKPKPRFRTRTKMVWDETYFYILTEMEEPDVWAKLKKRDSIIFFDNDFEVFIDPNGDTHRYYELEINAFSTEWDLFLDKAYRDGCRVLFNWDLIGMKSAVHINGTINQPGDKDTGWTLEIALPWEVLKECAEQPSPPKSGDQWRVNFSRVEWQTEVIEGKYEKVKNPDTGKSLPEDNWVWSPQGVVNMHYPEMWGFVQFSEKIAGSGSDEFLYNTEEDVKWALRQVYYKQKTHRALYGMFSDNINELELTQLEVSGYQWPPKIQHTESLFEAVLQSTDGNHQWRIKQDGLVWKTEN